MKKRCGWCKKAMGEKDPVEDTRTTDGICPECKKEQLEKIKAVRA